MKKIIALLLSVTMVLSLAGCNSKDNGGVDPKDSFTMWIYAGVDSSYYSDYKDNPALKYALKKIWGPENKSIAMDFIVPVAGTEVDSLNTLISTGEYPDIMDITRYTGSVKDLYTQGIVLDLTSYVEQYMPNYLAFLDQHPELQATSSYSVDGESKRLAIYTYSDKPEDLFAGYMYRRDWLVKYGTNPSDGSAFTGEYTKSNEDGSPDGDSWVDNVVFPSGGSDPVYISDWEWMFEIFTKAQEDLGITDSYCMSIPYGGSLATGDLVCAFGGGGSSWYRTLDNNCIFGATTDDFRVYVQAMNNWYKKGWLDPYFAEHASDQFYAIDDTNVRQGKVGLWQGVQGELGGRLDNGEGLTEGIVVYGASQPINDIYGTEAQKNKTPFCMLSNSLEGNFYIVTDKASEKDIASLCSFLDYFYSEEGSALKMYGLSREQYEETKDEFYTSKGLTEGAYYIDGNGMYNTVDTIKFDGGKLGNAAAVSSLPGLNFRTLAGTAYAESYQHSLDQWVKYKNTGFFLGSILNFLSDEDRKTWNKTDTSVTEFLNRAVPKMIDGTTDPFDDANWNSYKKAIDKYGVNKTTAIFQKLFAEHPIN